MRCIEYVFFFCFQPSFMSSSLDVTNEKEKREKRALQRKLSEMEEELRVFTFSLKNYIILKFDI